MVSIVKDLLDSHFTAFLWKLTVKGARFFRGSVRKAVLDFKAAQLGWIILGLVPGSSWAHQCKMRGKIKRHGQVIRIISRRL